MKDPFGSLLTLIRDDAAVAAIVGARVSGNPETPPSVQLVDNVSTRRPFGAESGRLGLQLWTGFAICRGPVSDTGAVTARQLAGAVSDALHGTGPRRKSTYLLRVYAPDIDGLHRDPEPPAGTGQPFYSVRIEAYAAAQAVP